MKTHRSIVLAWYAFVCSFPTWARASAQAPAESRFYYYQGDSIKLVSAPELMSGVLIDTGDIGWLTQQAVASGLGRPRVGTREFRPGFFVLQFDRGAEAPLRAYQAGVAASGRLRQLYPGFRTPNNSVVLLTGDLVARFKPSVTRAQIDSFAAAAHLDIASFSDEPGYRRYIFRTSGLQHDPIAIANALYESGLVEYATPDFITDRRVHGVPSDSFFADQFHLRNPVMVNGVPVDIAATTGSRP